MNAVPATGPESTLIPAWIPTVFPKVSGDMLEEPLRFDTAARPSSGDISMRSAIQNGLIELDSPPGSSDGAHQGGR
jgi:hypothetical protein